VDAEGIDTELRGDIPATVGVPDGARGISGARREPADRDAVLDVFGALSGREANELVELSGARPPRLRTLQEGPPHASPGR
jgi:hypothetical protein